MAVPALGLEAISRPRDREGTSKHPIPAICRAEGSMQQLELVPPGTRERRKKLRGERALKTCSWSPWSGNRTGPG